MDDLEKMLHDHLKIKSWLQLKEEGFYKKISPLSKFNQEYQLQYLHYTTYLKLFSAYKHLNSLNVKGLKYSADLCADINNFVTNLFSACDLLAKQIFIAYFDIDIFEDKTSFNIHLHKLEINVQKYKNKISPKIIEKYDYIYTTFVEPIINKKSSWYDELKNLRNNIAHGILCFLQYDINKQTFHLINNDNFINNYEYIIKSLPVHNHLNQCKQSSVINNMFDEMVMTDRLNLYFKNVSELANNVWICILELYQNHSKNVDWKF